MLLPSRLGYCCRRRGDAGNACSHVLVHSCTRMGGKAVGRGFTVHGQGSSGSGSAHQRLNKILSPPLHSLGSHCPRTLPAPGQHEPCVLVLPVRNALSPLLSLHVSVCRGRWGTRHEAGDPKGDWCHWGALSQFYTMSLCYVVKKKKKFF